MRLPKSVQEIADVIGYDKAVQLVRRLPPCGKRDRRRNLYVPKPKNLTTDHKLVHLVGWEDAQAMCEALGPKTLQPSLYYFDQALKSRHILTLKDAGRPINEIAMEQGCSEKWVQNVISVREMYRAGYEPLVISHALRINPITIGCILDIDVPASDGPVKRNPPPKPASPQFDLGL